MFSIILMSSVDPITNLDSLVKQGCAIIDGVRSDLTFAVKVGNSYHYDLFDILKTEFKSFESILTLMRSQHYKDCFIILRSILEMLLYFWLMVDAKKYKSPMTYIVKPSKTKTATELRDQIITNWMTKWKSGDSKYKHIEQLKKSKIHNDQFEIIYKNEGLYDDKDGYHIPYYYFLLTEMYDSSSILDELASVDSSIDTPENVEKRVRLQKQYYRLNMRFDAILENLLRNELISESQSEYIKVHYNFFSQYVHPSKNGIKPNTQSSDFDIYSEYSSTIFTELILLYVCRMQFIFLKIIVKKFENENPNAKTKNYLELMDKLDTATTDLWFFDGQPTNYDREVSRLSRRLRNMEEESKTPLMYYDDPLLRLKQMRTWIQQ